MKVALTVVKGPEAGRVMEFHEPRGFIIGRGKDTDLRLSPKDPYVSRRHVFLEICPPNCRLRDIGQTNPAHVNGEPATECELTDGDVIEVGYTQLKVSLELPVGPEIHNCGNCGRPIERLRDEPDVERCDACLEAEAGEATQAAQTTRLVLCSVCHANLTTLANSDGRADELQDVVVYACEKCVPGEDAGGAMVGGYELRGRLGEGGMGTVHLVYHRPTARVLVLKQMKDLKDPLLVKRFNREVRLLQSLVHGNIVRYVDTGIDDRGAPYLVTEYVTGGNLEGIVVASGGHVRPELGVSLICQVLDGLEYMHARSIIHRDVKPQNVLLRDPTSAESDLPRPKLSDFGLAYCYARAGGTRVTKPGTGLGTLMFMPPEQVRDAGSVTESADTYAVGVTLYYLLTGRYSFDFPTPTEIREFQQKRARVWNQPQEALRALMRLRRILHPFQIILGEEPVPVRERHPGIPRRVAAVVDKAVRKEPSERFQNAVEFREALHHAMDDASSN